MRPPFLQIGLHIMVVRKNRFLKSTTYNRWKSDLIPLEHHMLNFSPVGKVRGAHFSFMGASPFNKGLHSRSGVVVSHGKAGLAIGV